MNNEHHHQQDKQLEMENDTAEQPRTEQPEQAEQIQKDQKELTSRIQELEALKGQYQRLLADFDNFRRRTEREKLSFTKIVQDAVLQEVLSIVDDFDRALAAGVSAEMVGFELIYKTLLKLLERYGVEEISFQEQFDPTMHEAIMHVAAEGKPSGNVVAILQKGYRRQGVVLRPAKVSVVA